LPPHFCAGASRNLETADFVIGKESANQAFSRRERRQRLG